MPANDKASSVEYLRDHQIRAQNANSIVLVGGGAVGVQMALDLKERYPGKEVTLVQSRDRVMPNFHKGLHDIVVESFKDAGIR
jgi:NADH dehydrogenase FAD-containing subunit